MKKISLLILLTVFIMNLHADDNVARVVQYQDTFKLQDQPLALSDSALLWMLMHRQAQEIHRLDSLRRDSLLNSLRRENEALELALDSILARRRQMQDSIFGLEESLGYHKQEEVVQDTVAVVDSVLLEMDSIARFLAHETHIRPAFVEKSIIRDAQADMEDINAYLHRRKYWKRELNGVLNMTQNFSSRNWYKGSSSSFALLMHIKGFYNYNKDDISWVNTLEWKAGAATTGKADSLRKVNVTDDLFRLRSEFGYQVAKRFYVAASMEFNTTLWNSWNTNQKTAKTAFFTPMKYYINAGVDYKPIDGLKINVSPTVYRLIYACFSDDERHGIDVTKFGIEAGKNLKNEFGSSFRVNWDWKPLRELSLSTEFYFYTNYHAVELDWEIECQFVINRFLSTFLTLHPRYDSNYIMDGDTRAKLQFKEVLSLGFTHKFR